MARIKSRWRGLENESTLGLLLILPAVIIIGLVVLYPLLYTVVMSLFSKNLINPRRGTVWVGLDNYVKLLTDSSFLGALWNSIVLTTTSMIIQVVLAMTIAILLQKAFFGRGILRGVMILPWAVPTFVAAFAWSWLMDPSYGAVNGILQALGIIKEGIPWLGQMSTALATVVLANVWKGLPWVILTLSAGLQLVPQELQEAARTDGAGFWRELWHIILPSMSQVIAITIVLRTIWTFNWFDLVYLLTGGGPAKATNILPIEVYNTSFLSYQIGLASAIGTVMLVILGGFAILYFHLSGKEEL